MTTMLWILIVLQTLMGAFDSLFHHELTERLGWRPSQRRELALHSARDFIYAVLFLALAWSQPHGWWALLVAFLLVAEVLITLWDFVEEDRTRELPPSERITHALLALNYGAVLMLLAPVLGRWLLQPAGILPAAYGLWSYIATASACGVVVLGIRDLVSSLRCARLIADPVSAIAPALAGRHTILVTGATGFVGQRLTEVLSAYGHDVIALVRNPRKAKQLRPPFTLITSLDQIPDDKRIDTIVNLAGEPVAGGLWTAARRSRIIQSRVGITAEVVRLVARLAAPPRVLINASAIGWYGLWNDEALREDAPPHDCFTHEVCAAWEEQALRAEHHGVRVVLLRIGLVLGFEGGVLARLLLPFEFWLGGRIGSGKQWMSWIERNDLVRLIIHVIAHEDLSGPVNATAPEPVTNAEFARELGHALHRPALLPVPAAPLRWMAGALADEVLLGGQRILPGKAHESGFVFRYPTLRRALAAILGRPIEHLRSAWLVSLVPPH